MFCSIVIPTFNRARLLVRTLESVLKQTHADFECIVVDDGGNDDTRAVVESFGDARLHYHWKENRERGAARNYGVRCAVGRYVYFLDSDDRITPDHLAHGERIIERLHEPAVVHSRFAWETIDGRITGNQRYPRHVRSAIWRRNVVGSCLFVRRDVALAHPYVEDENFSVGEDWLHALVLATRYPIHLTDRVTRLVLTHPGQTMRGASARFEACGKLLLQYLRADPVTEGIERRRMRWVEAEVESLLALQVALEGSTRRALALQLRAIKLRPSLAFERRTFAIAKHTFRAALR